jgi:hypothetical protein
MIKHEIYCSVNSFHNFYKPKRITKTSFKNAQFLPSSQKLEQVIYELVETFKITQKHNSQLNDGEEIISLRSGDS